MSLSLSQRSVFYDELGKLIRSGYPFLKSVETMLEARAAAGLRSVLRRLRASAQEGHSLADSLAARGMPFAPMEKSVLRACEHSGQIPRGCEYLSRYFARLEKTRRTIWKRAAYPLFLLHFGIVMLALPKLFQPGQTFSLANDILLPLATFYIFAIAVWLLLRSVVQAAESSTVLDGMLRRVPLFGKIRQSLALSRFCSSYLMQLDASVNVMDSLESAADASQSAIIRSAIDRILPSIREGGQVGVALAQSSAFPTSLTRSLLIGEQTGSLDEELTRAAEFYDQRAIAAIETLTEWIPRMIYLVIVIYLAWNIIGAFRQSLSGLEKMMEP